MSDIVGADLAHLETLSTAFQTAGDQIAAKTQVIESRLQQAVGQFEATLSSLQSEAATLTSSIDAEMDAVAGQADGVQWTGANRSAFDGDLTRFKSVVATGTAQIDADISAIKAQVDSSFTPVLTEFGVALKASGDEVDAATTQMNTAVSTQRTNLDQAANVGWTSA